MATAAFARGWCCFCCRRGGTIYDLAGAVWGRSTRGRDFIELRRRLLDCYLRQLGGERGRTADGGQAAMPSAIAGL